VSNAEDMNKWLTMLIRVRDSYSPSGKNKTQLMPAKYWKEMFSKHQAVFMGAHRPVFPESDTIDSLGLGWKTGCYRGTVYGFCKVLLLLLLL